MINLAIREGREEGKGGSEQAPKFIHTRANGSHLDLHPPSPSFTFLHSQINMAMGAGTLATGAMFVAQPGEGLATAALMTNAGLTGEFVY